MSEVINLDDHRPHMQGQMKCTACKHEFQAVTPIGTDWAECPECHLHRATWVNTVLKAGDHYTCIHCGCQTFQISNIYQVYCPVCGIHHGDFKPVSGWEEG